MIVREQRRGTRENQGKTAKTHTCQKEKWRCPQGVETMHTVVPVGTALRKNCSATKHRSWLKLMGVPATSLSQYTWSNKGRATAKASANEGNVPLAPQVHLIRKTQSHTDAVVKLVAITSSRPFLSLSATVTKLGEGTDGEMA